MQGDVVARERAFVVARERALVVARERALVVSRERALVVSRERALVVSRERALVVSRERALVVSRERALVVSRERAVVVSLERACLTALPALRHGFDGPFVTKAFLGGTGRANSVCSTDPAPDPELEARVGRIERGYARLGLPCRFRLTPLDPPGLEALLCARGYADGEETIVHAGPARPVADAAVRRLEGPEPAWMEVVATAEYQSERRRAEKLRNPELLAVPGAWLLLREDGVDAACVFAVADGRYCGIFDLATRPAFRRRGLGERIIGAAAHWAAGLGADTLWAQVATTNVPSLALQRRMGLREVYRYRYLMKAISVP